MIKYDIFINYRHEDTRPMAVVLNFLLHEAFYDLNIFIDQDSLQIGKWRDDLRDALIGSTMVITLVGQKWLEVRNEVTKKNGA